MKLLQLREKKAPVRSGGFGFIPKGAIGKTVGLSYKAES